MVVEAIKFELPQGFDAPCADISYQWISEANGRLLVLMHFSRAVGNSDFDLELTFREPDALQWEEESFGLIDLPQDIPRLSVGWAYPALIIKDSEWANRYAAMLCCSEEELRNRNTKHYAFLSMNDFLHVLSKNPPVIRVVKAENI
jgi:hypothetical protein